MVRLNRYLCGVLLILFLSGSAFAHRPLTRQEVRDKFELANTIEFSNQRGAASLLDFLNP